MEGTDPPAEVNDQSFTGLSGVDIEDRQEMAADLFFETIKNYVLPEPGFLEFGWVLQQTAIDLGFSASDREIVRKACKAIEIIAPGSALTIIAGDGSLLVQFLEGGDMFIVSGVLLEDRSDIQLPYEPSDSVTEFLIRGGGGGGTKKGLLKVFGDGSYKGQVWINATLQENRSQTFLQTQIDYPSKTFVVRNGTDILAVLSDQGILFLKGEVKSPQ